MTGQVGNLSDRTVDELLAVAALISAGPLAVEVTLTAAQRRAVNSAWLGLRKAWTAEDPAEAAVLVNALLRRFRPVRQLVGQGDGSWRLRVPATPGPPGEHVLQTGLLAIATAIEAGEYQRLKRCLASGCVAVMLDVSPNRIRRWCSPRCQNRMSQAAFRDRERAAVAGGMIL